MLLLKYAGVAQSVEQLIRNQQVSGSSPLTSSIKKVQERCGFLDFFAFMEALFSVVKRAKEHRQKPFSSPQVLPAPLRPQKAGGPARAVGREEPQFFSLVKACFGIRYISCEVRVWKSSLKICETLSRP